MTEPPEISGPPAPPSRIARLLRSRFLIPAVIFASFLALFAVMRTVLLLVHRQDFVELDAGQVALSYWRGLRFDSSITTAFLAVPFLGLLLPFAWAERRAWRLIWGWYAYAILLLFGLIAAVDVIYFGFVHRHAGTEAAALANDTGFVVQHALFDYWPALLGFGIGVLLLAWGWHRLLRLRVEPFASKRPAAVACLLLVPLCILAIRGGVRGKPVDIVNAFDGVPWSAGLLTLNGPFSVLHATFSAGPVSASWGADLAKSAEAIARVQAELSGPGTQFVDPEYPLLRKFVPSEKPSPLPGGPLNVVILLFESWDAHVTDSIECVGGREGEGATPEFDRLSRQGVLFTRFFANGQRSAEAFSAILAAYPRFSSMPYLGQGMEMNRLGFMGTLAARNGYSTICIQGSRRSSYRLDAISQLAGFERYYGAEDIPETGHAGFRHPMGAWDHDTLQFAHAQFAAARAPFLGFVFLLTGHGPHALPDPKWQKRPPDTRTARYLNVMQYIDWSLGRFMEAARKAGYHDRTVFVILSDHASGMSMAPQEFPERHHVPCLIVGPGLEPRVCGDVASQTDLLPTLAHLAGWKGLHASIGRPLFDPAPSVPPFALCVSGDVLTWVESCGWVSHTLRQRVAASRQSPPAELERMERRLTDYARVGLTTLQSNRLYGGPAVKSDDGK